MSIAKRIFHLIEITGTEQKSFARAIGTTDKVVSTWKKNSRSYQKYLVEISNYFHVPPNYLLGEGVFKNWDKIMLYPISVHYELRRRIPYTISDPGIGDRDNTILIAWLDKRMCYGIRGEDELDLIRWFYRAVDSVEVVKKNNISEEIDEAQVTISFRPEYEDSILGTKKLPIIQKDNGEDPEMLELLRQVPPERMPEVERYLRFLLAEQEAEKGKP